MYELIGWAVVAIRADGESERGETDDVRDWARTASEQLFGERVEVIGRGGSTLLQAAFIQNRDRGDRTRFMDFLTELGQRAPGTYGMFYVHDEDRSESFDRIAVRRGAIELVPDDLFSPRAPTIEDY